MPDRLADLLIARAGSDPGALAFGLGDRTLSFGELGDRAQILAQHLETAGVRRADRVALVLGAGESFIEHFWALQLIGAVPCAFAPGAPAETLERRVNLIRPRLTITEDGPHGARDVEPEPGDLAFLQLTSGTSGAPRAARISQANILAFFRDTQLDGHVKPDDVMVGWVPPWHDLGLVRFVIGAVAYGVPCHVVEPAIRTIPQWFETIQHTGGTLSGGPDFAFRLAMRMIRPGALDLSSLRWMTNGGEPVRSSTVHAFEEHFGVGHVLVPGYGMAETTLGLSTHAPGEPIVTDEHGVVSCGAVQTGLEARVVDGEIVVRGEVVFQGYLDALEDTAQALRDGWLYTGDEGYFDDEGRLFVLGRRAGMIKRAGAAIAPRELEEAAQRVLEVRVAAATSTLDTRGGDEVITIVVESEADGDQVAAAVSRALSEAIGFAPGRVLVVPPRSIPITANGKIRHQRLRQAITENALG